MVALVLAAFARPCVVGKMVLIYNALLCVCFAGHDHVV